KSFKNENFELAPREVKINELNLMNWDQLKGIIEIKIKCSAGTYIRSIARDLGKILNSEGCLLQLKRIAACGFDEQNSIKISAIEKETMGENSKNFIIPTISALNHISTFVLSNEEQINFWQTGRAIKFDINYFKESESFDYKKPIKVIDKKQTLFGIGFLNENESNINPKLVLNAK
ncbi:pseudouridine synthase, partial [Prochlorococcus sp. AH-736-B04]|nr:pseudouridine synthase [Prochlorococcus sp. AH-736-B04]